MSKTEDRLKKRIVYLEAQLDCATADLEEALKKIRHLEEQAAMRAQAEHALARRRSYGNGASA